MEQGLRAATRMCQSGDCTAGLSGGDRPRSQSQNCPMHPGQEGCPPHQLPSPAGWRLLQEPKHPCILGYVNLRRQRREASLRDLRWDVGPQLLLLEKPDAPCAMSWALTLAALGPDALCTLHHLCLPLLVVGLSLTARGLSSGN